MRKVCLLLAITGVALGQDYHRHNFSAGGGAGLPLFARSRSIWEDGALFTAGYGFRFHRRLQADAAYTRVFSPADKQLDPFEPVLERRELGGGKLESFLVGGRILFPVHDRLLLSAGMGAAHERFGAPRLSAGATLNQTGWGGYVLGAVRWTLDGAGHFHLIITPRLEVIQARDAWLHRNRWLMLPVEFGFSF